MRMSRKIFHILRKFFQKQPQNAKPYIICAGIFCSQSISLAESEWESKKLYVNLHKRGIWDYPYKAQKTIDITGFFCMSK